MGNIIKSILAELDITQEKAAELFEFSSQASFANSLRSKASVRILLKLIAYADGEIAITIPGRSSYIIPAERLKKIIE